MNPPIRHRLSPGQVEALTEIAHLRERGEIRLFETVPASEYTDPTRYDLEKRAIFEREPLIAAPSCLLPKPNMYAQIDMAGMPVLLTRDKQGVARAFANVCMHRGTILCPSDKVEKGARLVCPYHAWTYALDGRLVGVPREDVFPGLNKADYRLKELPSAEAGGLIWIGLKPGADVDFSEPTGALAADLDGLGLGDMRIYRSKTYKLEANWKLVQDTMLDSYHVARLHRNSVGQFFTDAPEVSHMVGSHVRCAGERANFTVADINEDFAISRRTSVFTYAFFPTSSLVVSPRYVSLCVLRPVDFGRTDLDYYMLITDPPKDETAEAKLIQSWDLMDKVFGEEDFWAAELGHKGLAGGVLEELVVGGAEHRLKMYHDVLIAKIAAYQRGAASND